MYERHKRRYSLCDISKVDRAVDVVLLKVRSHARHVPKLPGSFFSWLQWPGPWPSALGERLRSMCGRCVAGVGLLMSRFLKGCLVGPESQHRVACFKIRSHAREDITLLRIPLQSCSSPRRLSLCPCLTVSLPPPPVCLGVSLCRPLTCCLCLLVPLSFVWACSVCCFCCLSLTAFEGRYIYFLWKVLQLICLLKWQRNPFGLT